MKILVRLIHKWIRISYLRTTAGTENYSRMPEKSRWVKQPKYPVLNNDKEDIIMLKSNGITSSRNVNPDNSF